VQNTSQTSDEMTSPFVAIDDTQRRYDRHAGEGRYRKNQPAVFKTAIDDTGQEQRR